MVFPADSDRSPISVGGEREKRADDPRGSWQADDSEANPGQKYRSAPPIFLHSSWRASHTWFWLKFRKHASTVCFYEPFHERLATLTRSEALSLGPNSWNSRHPAAEPYLREFTPLVRKSGGVRLFVPEISHRWFLPVGGPIGNLHTEELKYLALLIRHAERLRRIPVFGFTRSLGRLSAIKRQFPGVHIFQYRNLWTQWMSWIDYKRNKDNYFFHRLLCILIETEDPYLLTITNRHLPHGVNNLKTKMKNSYDGERLATELLESISENHLFILYMAFHTYLYMCAKAKADVVIDTAKVANDENYRNRACHQLTCATGLPIRLDDVSETQRYHPFDPAGIDWNEIRENVDFAVVMLDHGFDRRELLRYGMELVDETVAEIEISEKYVATARNEMMTLTSERDSAAAARTALAAERERLVGERDGLLAERDLLLRQYGAATAEVDRLAAELAANAADQEKLIAENARLRCEVARTTNAGAQQASAIAVLYRKVAALRTEFSRVEADRDRTVEQSERWFSAAVVWPSKRGLSTRRLRPGQWFQRLKLWFCAGLTGRWISRVNPRDSTRTRANGARDACQWELAARFYGDYLNRNSSDPAIWIQFGHALKEARRLSEAETAYRAAVILNGGTIDALLSLSHVLILQQKRAEAAPIYTRALGLEILPPLRSAIVKELELLHSSTETTLSPG
jgi:tetratricopeptide (TPR) repeat protein